MNGEGFCGANNEQNELQTEDYDSTDAPGRPTCPIGFSFWPSVGGNPVQRKMTINIVNTYFWLAEKQAKDPGLFRRPQPATT